MNTNKSPGFSIIQPDLQISFYCRLKECRRRFLSEALVDTVRGLDIARLDDELAEYIKPDVLSKVASHGIRGELLFPVPCIFQAQPFLLGYYRLLYGISQKEFYRYAGMSQLKRMEEKGEISEAVKSRLGDLCRSLVVTGQLLLEGIDDYEIKTFRDLQLLTLGAQLRGGQNTSIGKKATQEIFTIIEALVHENIVEQKPSQIIVKNAAGRRISIAFSADPDIAIKEEGMRNIVSIEIKGGTDVSNIHNRLGEAEKSHLNAKNQGYFEFWTIIGANVPLDVARQESPATSRFFHLTELRKSQSREYNLFRNILHSLLGFKLN